MGKVQDEQTDTEPTLPSATSCPSSLFFQPVTLIILLNPKVGGSLRKLELQPWPSDSRPCLEFWVRCLYFGLQLPPCEEIILVQKPG